MSLKSVSLDESYNSPDSALLAAMDFCANTIVKTLTINCYELDSLCALNLGRLIAENDNLNSVELNCNRPLTRQSMDHLTRAVVENWFILDFTINANKPARSMAGILAALRRNRMCLHRAICFVLGRNRGKRCAEAFELLSSKASLIAKVVTTSGVTEAEAKAAVEAAKRFIRHNYLLVNRVFQHKLECRPGNGTQIDQLNFDCWLGITKYLKVSDIV